MEFDEVNSYIYRDARQPQTSTDYDRQLMIHNNNPYNSLIQNHNQSTHQLITRKPTLSNFVNRLKQQSSKTRFVREYKRMAANVSDQLQQPSDPAYLIQDDVASLRIIDPSRDWTRDEEEPSDDYNVTQLVIADNNKKKKKVYIDETANQFQSPNDQLSINEVPPDRFLSMDKAIDFIKNDIESIQDDIEREIRKITLSQEEIIKYQQEFEWMQTQLDSTRYSLASIMKENLIVMKLHKERALENKLKIQENKNKNTAQKHRFEKYRRAITIETRLFELEKKITAAWRRDEIWAQMRDLGFPSALLLIIIGVFVAWQTK